MQMTAIVLAMGCDEKVVIEGANLHAVADPYAVQRWVDNGVEAKVALHQHW
jgi:electron transfer flavoprotein alpha/beta subunit